MHEDSSKSNSLKILVTRHLGYYLYQKAYTRAVFTILGLALKELRVSFRQFFTWRSPVFSFLRVVKYAFWACFRVFMGRSVRVSYAYTGEDRIIESLLKPFITYNGFYVDVGCNHPRFISNTFLLYRRGWRGICIDANAALIKKYRYIRPRDEAVCALVSDKKEEKEFVELTNNVLSSVETEHLEDWQSKGQQVIAKHRMQTCTLTEILDKNNAPAMIDILSVDVEGYDWEALRSWDFERYIPRMIVVEADDFDAATPDKHYIYQFLIQKNYVFKGSILTNLYFMQTGSETWEVKNYARTSAGSK